MKTNIDAYHLYPIRTLTTLTKKEKEHLIAKDIILVKELGIKSDYWNQLNLTPVRNKKVLAEIGQLCRTNL